VIGRGQGLKLKIITH